MTDILFNNKPYICKVFTNHIGTKEIKLYRHDGQQTIQPSRWIPHLAPNEVAICNEYDTEGILPVLIKSNVIHSPHRYVDNYAICLVYENK
jgi:hypothetical protein